MTTAPKEITINNARYVLVEEKKPFIIDVSYKLEVCPHDLQVMTYVNAVKAVAKLNTDKAFSHDDWFIPTLEQLREMYKNRDASFCTTESTGSDSPDWYWSSTELRVNSSIVHSVRFSDGNEGWLLKDDVRLSCRPVRLVVA